MTCDLSDDARDALRQAVSDQHLTPSRGLTGLRLGFVKGDTQYQREIRGILAAVADLAEDQDAQVMRSLGVTPIRFDGPFEIPTILQEISNGFAAPT